ncbi:DUF2510 domain-containing protein [uncultured Jatrophihabitans sp.]|uniref:DUF2510 domain-containing protein n=1 Tax=uncultured Jatrophihabitans sp. TaxID=1610747 RepID=UPI0035CC36D5
MADAGWYPDPQDSNAEQYWDGQMWTGHRRGAGSSGGGSGGADQSAAQETRSNLTFQSAPEPAAPQPQWQGEPAAYQPTQSYQPTQNYQPTQSYLPTQGYQSPQGYQPTQDYPQSGYQQPGYGQPGYGQPGYEQPGYGQPGFQQGSSAHPWAGAPAPVASKKRRNILIAAVVAVALIAAGLVALLVLPGDDAPSITYQGNSIKDAAAVLSSAESSVTKTVSARHGVKSNDTRCYFVQAEKPADGTKKSDVDSSLSCGPVLFVDGNTAQEYLPVRLTAATSGGKAVLTPQSSLDSVDPSSVRSGYKLVRPDGETAPSGNGGLKVPQPQSTQQDSITTASLGSTTPPSSLTNAVMVGRTRKVTVTAAGFIPRYGTGTDARSAPSGQKLLAFRTTYDIGAVSSGTGAQVKLVVGGTTHDVPTATTGEYVIAAVPDSSAPTLQLIDSGDTQTLSLPQGQPGANNIAVLTRTHRTQVLGRTFNVPILVRKGTRKGNATFKTTATLASLDYWPPANTAVKASSPRNALLSVRINYFDSTQSGGPYGYDPSQLRLKLPNGSYVKARNIAPKGKIANVFEVPATFTTGTLQITGTQRFSNGVTSTVRTTKEVAISIAAG